MNRCGVVIATLLLSMSLVAEPSAEHRVINLAEGVYAIEHEAAPDGNVSGNTTVIIGDRVVFVVDSCYLPSLARQDIAKIKQWTNEPVAYLLNTHFHNDHNNGNKAYLEAYPSLTIIAQVETKRDMDLIQPGNIERTPRHLATQIAAFKQGKYPNGRELSASDKKEVEALLPGLEKMQVEWQTLSYQPPTLTFTDELDIDLGNREVQVKFLGRGNTAGDAIVYVPKEKILVAGDLLVHPIPYTFDGYPAEWSQTLRKMSQLPIATIVPGHGPVQHDTKYLTLVADLLASTVEQIRARVRQVGHPGFHSPEELTGSVDLSEFRKQFAGEDKDLQAEFDDMAKHLLKIAYEEAAVR